MKKTLSLLLVLVMVLSLCSVTAFAAENYTGKTVILYTANVRGDVDVYAKVAAAKTAYIERKLFTLNSGHAICAYLGCLRGHHTILDSVSDPVIGPIVYRAMQQSGAGLVKKFSMDEQKHQAYIDRIFARFHNPYLQDEVARVGREPIRKLAASDRLSSPLLTAYNFGLPVDQLIFGAAAALRYDNAEDPQSVELQKTIAEQGAAAALEQYSGLAADHPLSTRILDVFRALAV